MDRPYHRIELDYPLDIDEVAEQLLTGSGGTLTNWQKKPPKHTDGCPDKDGAHYSLQNWGGGYTPGTGSRAMMPGKKTKETEYMVVVGITDYEYLGPENAGKRASGRRAGHRHFFAHGNPFAVMHVIDIFRAVIPGTLWRDEEVSGELSQATVFHPPDGFTSEKL